MERLKLPPALPEGGCIAIVGPSSPAKDPEDFHRARAFLEERGYRIKEYVSATARHGFLAGSDALRAAELQDAMEDTEVHAVLCLRGGYGSGRILPMLDFKRMGRTPKALIGFSDITSILNSLVNQGKTVAFHGPTMLHYGKRSERDMACWSGTERLLRICQPLGSMSKALPGIDWDPMPINRGRTEGRLMGGNLAIIASLAGTPWQPNFAGAIVCLEDVGEPAYRIDRYLQQIRQAGMFDKVMGVLLGDFRSGTRQAASGEELPANEAILHDFFKDLDAPVLAGAPFGHIPKSWTLPFGVRAELDVDAGELILLEAAVGNKSK